ncbi:MAG: hypothetical protein R2830_07075 [Saprospiraceae bacterium]
MNSFKLYTAFYLLLFTASPLLAQVFDLYELSLYKKKGADPSIRIENGSIAEINSTLVVNINKDAIAGKAQLITGGAAVNSADLAKLKTLLKNQQRILELLNEDVAGPNFEKLGELANYMIAFANEVAGDSVLNGLYNEAFNDYMAKLQAGQVSGSPDAYIFSYFVDKTEELAAKIAHAMNQNDVKFSLAGSLRSRRGRRPIKLSDEFDNLAAEYFTVPQFEFTLSDSDKKELQQIANFTQNIKALKEQGEKKIDEMLNQTFQSKQCLEDLTAQLQNINERANVLFPQLADQVKMQLQQPYLEASQLVLKYTKGQGMANDITNVQLLVGFNDDLVSTQQKIDSLIAHMDKGLAAIFTDLPNDPVIGQLKQGFSDCKNKLEADRNRMVALVQDVTTYLEQARRTIEATEKISEKIKRLGYSQIPQQAFIDLTESGFRENGDKLHIKAVIWRESGGQEVPMTIDERIFTVQQIGVYSVVKPLLLLANPFDDNSPNVDLGGKFQFAPSYSILFKVGSRKSSAFNNFWSPGIGFNFAATDFNTDGTPEFGAGLELSLIRDYLAAGLGYNFGADEPYFYFGFRLPFGAVPLPLFNNVEIQD